MTIWNSHDLDRFKSRNFKTLHEPTWKVLDLWTLATLTIYNSPLPQQHLLLLTHVNLKINLCTTPFFCIKSIKKLLSKYEQGQWIEINAEKEIFDRFVRCCSPPHSLRYPLLLEDLKTLWICRLSNYSWQKPVIEVFIRLAYSFLEGLVGLSGRKVRHIQWKQE